MKKLLNATTMERRLAAERLAKLAGKTQRVAQPGPATNLKTKPSRHKAEPRPVLTTT